MSAPNRFSRAVTSARGEVDRGGRADHGAGPLPESAESGAADERRARPSRTEGRRASREGVAPGGPSLEALMRQGPFGPAFFLVQLRALVREQCPDPAEGLPAVQLRLADGETIDLCHIIAVGPAWVALAVHETGHPSSGPAMRTELIPYPMIARVALRSAKAETPHHGFDLGRAPQVLEGVAKHDTPEASLQRAAGLEGG